MTGGDEDTLADGADPARAGQPPARDHRPRKNGNQRCGGPSALRQTRTTAGAYRGIWNRWQGLAPWDPHVFIRGATPEEIWGRG